MVVLYLFTKMPILQVINLSVHCIHLQTEYTSALGTDTHSTHAKSLIEPEFPQGTI